MSSSSSSSCRCSCNSEVRCEIASREFHLVAFTCVVGEFCCCCDMYRSTKGSIICNSRDHMRESIVLTTGKKKTNADTVQTEEVVRSDLMRKV